MNISFFYTQQQVRDGTKDITRRLGWVDLQPDTLLHGIVKGQGLKPGEKIQPLRDIIVTSVRRERLNCLTDYLNPGPLLVYDRDAAYREVVREGFPDLSPPEFVAMFCDHMKCDPDVMVQRIEFRYV